MLNEHGQHVKLMYNSKIEAMFWHHQSEEVTEKYKGQSEAESQKPKYKGQCTSGMNSLLTGAWIDDSGRFWALEGYAIIAHVEYSIKMA